MIHALLYVGWLFSQIKESPASRRARENRERRLAARKRLLRLRLFWFMYALALALGLWWQA
jgi:hypothetical protein